MDLHFWSATCVPQAAVILHANRGGLVPREAHAQRRVLHQLCFQLFAKCLQVSDVPQHTNGREKCEKPSDGK